MTAAYQSGLRGCNGHAFLRWAIYGKLRLMAALALYTHALIQKLKAAGFDDQQAEAVTSVFATTRNAFDLATKADLREVELKLNAHISDVKAEFIKWMLGTIGFQTLVILGAVVTLVKVGH